MPFHVFAAFMAVTMPLGQARLLDLLAQELCRSPLTDRSQICSRLTPRLAQESTAHARSSQRPGHGLAGSWSISFRIFSA